MTALADFLEKLPEKKFDMAFWVSKNGARVDWHEVGSCGTSACVASWAWVLMIPDKTARDAELKKLDYFDDEPRMWLDLTGCEGDWLFLGEWSGKHTFKNSNVGVGTPQEAAQAIRAMITAGGIPPNFTLKTAPISPADAATPLAGA